jgi:hypothetical protein
MHRRLRLWGHVLEAILIALFVAQLFINFKLRQRVVLLEDQLARMRAAANSDHYRVGEVVSPLPVRTLNGREFLLNPAAVHRKMLLLFINPACDSCRTALNDLNTVDLNQLGIVVVAVSPAQINAMVDERHLADFTYVLIAQKTQANVLQKLSHIPLVLLVDEGGRIQRTCSRPLDCVTTRPRPA